MTKHRQKYLNSYNLEAAFLRNLQTAPNWYTKDLVFDIFTSPPDLMLLFIRHMVHNFINQELE